MTFKEFLIEARYHGHNVQRMGDYIFDNFYVWGVDHDENDFLSITIEESGIKYGIIVSNREIR